MLVFKKLHSLGADALKQSLLDMNIRNIDVQYFRNPLFRHALLNGGQNHVAFLNRRDTAYSLVVSKSFIVRGNEAGHFGDAKIAESFKTEMPIQEEVLVFLATSPRYDRRFDQPYFADG